MDEQETTGLQEPNATVDGVEQQDTSGAQQEKTFTQEEVNALIAKNKAKAATKAKSEYESSEEYKAYMAWKESNKTEQDKLNEQLAQYNQVKQQNENLVKQVACMKANIKEDCIADVVALANNYISEEVDIEAAIKLVSTKYPQFSNIKEETATVDKPFQFGTKTTPKSAANKDPFVEAFWGTK